MGTKPSLTSYAVSQPAPGSDRRPV